MKLTSRYSRNSRKIRTYFPNKWTAEEIDISGGLSALTADLGTITAGVLQSSDWAASAGIQLDLDNKTFKMGGSNVTAAGAAAGIFLGLDTSYKWYIGNGLNVYLKFDGTNLIIGPDTLIGAGSVDAENVSGWAHASDLTKMDGGDIYAGSITATSIAAATITGAKIAAGTIETSNIKANAITSALIAANTITAGDIAAGTITTTEIAANTINAGNIAAGAVDTSELAAQAVTAEKIETGTITATQLAANSVTSSQIQADAVTASKIDVSTLSAISAYLGSVTVTTGLGITINDGGNITLNAGGDLILSPHASSPAIIKWDGSSYNITIGMYNTTGTQLWALPSTDAVCDWLVGSLNIDTVGTNYRFKKVLLRAYESTQFITYYNATYYAHTTCYASNTLGGQVFLVATKDANAGSDDYVVFENLVSDSYTFFLPGGHKHVLLGASNHAFDDAYADDWNNVADFYHFDDYDDLAELHKIKGSGEYDPDTGYELIDDNSLPEILKLKSKEYGYGVSSGNPRDVDGTEIRTDPPTKFNVGEDILDPDGKPFIPLKNAISHIWGCIRQLDNRVKEEKVKYEEIIQTLKDDLDKKADK